MRLDRWLWAARFFKTRALAAEAVGGGKVEVNGEKAKRARLIGPGDRLRIRLGPYEHLVTVQDVSERRGPASEAVKLFAEDEESRQRREWICEQHRLAAQEFPHGTGKPSRKQRREWRRLKGG